MPPGTSKNGKNPRQPPAKEPATTKDTKDTIMVSNTPPESSKHGNDVSCFASSSKIYRTPPQATSRPTPLPDAPSRLTHGKLTLSDFAESDDETHDARETGSPEKTPTPSTTVKAPTATPHKRATSTASSNCEDESHNTEKQKEKRSRNTKTPIDSIPMLCSIMDKLNSMNTRGQNKAIKDQVIKELGQVIDTLMEEERTREPHSLNRPHAEVMDQISSMEKDIKEILTAVQASSSKKPKTWAQVVEDSDGLKNIRLEAVKRDRLEKVKKQRAETEVMLSVRNAVTETQEYMKNTEEKAIAEMLQQTITAGPDNLQSVKIQKVTKMSNQMLKIQCRTKEDAVTVREVNWEAALQGGTVVKTTYGIVMDGIPKQYINPETQSQEEMKTCIEANNDIEVKRVICLRKKPRNPNALTHSIVAFTECPKEADHCIEHGVRIENEIFAAKRYTPQCQIKQCFKCQAYGHKAEVCTRKTRCGKCAQEHETRDCNNEELKCANCGSSHAA
jgi:hypothetical protein